MYHILDTSKQSTHHQSGGRDWSHLNQRHRFAHFQGGLAQRSDSAATNAEVMLGQQHRVVTGQQHDLLEVSWIDPMAQ